MEKGEKRDSGPVESQGDAEFHYKSVTNRGKHRVVVRKGDVAEEHLNLRAKIPTGPSPKGNNIGQPGDDESAEGDKERLSVEEESKELIFAFLRRFRVFDVAEKQISEGEEYESGAHKEGGVFHRTRFDAVKGIVLIHCPPDCRGEAEHD
ncbi:MAG: hypothetical protein J6X38_07770 [Abditibacteriota bacterium]|nr:hypothetical protein [Abditibacteriota bacterium]